MTNVSGLIRRQAKKTNFLVSPRAAELSVIFTEDRRQVLTNVPTGSTPFPFRACRTIPGTKARTYDIRDTPPRSIDLRYRD
jgi:hypothetical protein